MGVRIFIFKVNRFKAIGGTSPEDHIRRIFRFIFANKLACLYNWEGTDKKTFKDTHVIQLIYGTYLEIGIEAHLPGPSSSSSDINENIKVFFSDESSFCSFDSSVNCLSDISNAEPPRKRAKTELLGRDINVLFQSEDGPVGVRDAINLATIKTEAPHRINFGGVGNSTTTFTQRITTLSKATTVGTSSAPSKIHVNPFLSYLEYLKSLKTTVEYNDKMTNTRTKEVTEGVDIREVTRSPQHISKSNRMKTNSTQETNDVNVETMKNNAFTVSSFRANIMGSSVENSSVGNADTATKREEEKIERTVYIPVGESTTKVPQSKMNEEILQSSIQSQTGSSPMLKTTQLQDQKVCNSTNCDLTAARIMSLMDYSKQPCENFYEFACGGILGRKREKLDIFSPKLLNGDDNPEFIDKFNTFYHSCLKHEDRFNYRTRIIRAKNLLGTIGSFHFDGQTNKTYNITEFVANLVLFKAMPLFEVDIDIDPDVSSYILKIMMPDQTSIVNEHWSSLSESKRKCLRETNEKAVGSPLNMTLLYGSFRSCQMNYSDFLDSIDTAVIELGIFSHLTEKDIFKHIRDIRVFIEFEIFSLFEEMVVRRKYEMIKLNHLERQFPIIEWEKLFRMISNVDITNETVIQIYNKQYFEDVFRGLSLLNKGMLNNAFLAILANSLFENTVLPSHKHSRTDYCKERSEELMPDIMNYLYKKIIPAEELNEHNVYTAEIYSNLAKSFNKSLDNRDWLDDFSKASIRKKLEKIQLVMFRNDDVVSEAAYLLDGYGDIILKDSDYQYNFFYLMKFRRKRLFSLQGHKVNSENMFRYFVDATTEEPVFFYASDIVCIPYGLTKKAARDLPSYIVMAQVGFPLAKIIGYAFDPIGLQYRLQLSETANISYLNFAEQTKDMIVLSNPIKFGDQEFAFSLNNALSESERIAENTALRILTDSFETFENDTLLPWISYKFKKEKIFFLAMTQELCRDMGFAKFMIEAHESHILPPQFRIENIVGNSEEFLKQFNCRPGSAMTRFEDRLQFPYLIALSKEDLDYMN